MAKAKSNTHTRRSVLAGAAAATIPTAAIASVTSAVPDPIFAAIERHRALYLKRLVTSNKYCDFDDEKDWAADTASRQAVKAAGRAIIETTPTTMAGVLALLDYVREFNTGGLALPDDAWNWHSTANDWPQFDDDTVALNLDGCVETHTFPLFVMRNVAKALRAIEVQS